MRRALLSLALLLSACTRAGTPSGDEAGAEPGELRRAAWNGLDVRSEGYLEEAALLFARGGRIVHRERDESAHHWALHPPRDLDGDGDDDLHAWFWTGGAHCCITHVVFPGTPGRDPASPGKAWRLDQGDGEAGRFEAVEGYPRPVLTVPDTSSAYVSGSFADTPMFPYFVELGPDGLRLAEPLMRSRAPGHGPAVLADGPPPLAAFVRAAFGDEIARTGRIPPPEERVRALRTRIDRAFAAAAPDSSPEAVLAAGDLLPDIERHIKLYCVYDADCDIPALAAQLEGSRPALLSAWAAELETSWRNASLHTLKRNPR